MAAPAVLWAVALEQQGERNKENGDRGGRERRRGKAETRGGAEQRRAKWHRSRRHGERWAAALATLILAAARHVLELVFTNSSTMTSLLPFISRASGGRQISLTAMVAGMELGLS
jgi:hypothetical protein